MQKSENDIMGIDLLNFSNLFKGERGEEEGEEEKEKKKEEKEKNGEKGGKEEQEREKGGGGGGRSKFIHNTCVLTPLVTKSL